MNVKIVQNSIGFLRLPDRNVDAIEINLKYILLNKARRKGFSYLGHLNFTNENKHNVVAKFHILMLVEVR